MSKYFVDRFIIGLYHILRNINKILRLLKIPIYVGWFRLLCLKSELYDNLRE